ncbi:MAG TPA: DUF1559 domain-containing protein [Lacipirellulaceae bacterium]|nr:DUF1559 domain-containing protein [Lacipirellulaceae bacterium]
MRCTPRRRPAFFVLDALIGLVATSVILLLLIPAVLRTRETSRGNLCKTHLKQIGEALQRYYASNEHFPPGGSSKNELSWHVLILPMLGYDALFDQFDVANGPYQSKTVNHRNNPYGLVTISEFECPTALGNQSESEADAVNERHSYTVHYYGILGPRGESASGATYRVSSQGPFAEQGILGYDSHTRLADITDGTSRTILVGELSWSDARCYRSWVRGCNDDTIAGAKNVQWPIATVYFGKQFSRRYEHYIRDGNASGFNDVSLGSEHLGGTHLLMADGAVKFVPETIDLFVYRGAASVAGGEKESLDGQ